MRAATKEQLLLKSIFGCHGTEGYLLSALLKLNQFHFLREIDYVHGEGTTPDGGIASLRQRFDTLSLNHSRDVWQVWVICESSQLNSFRREWFIRTIGEDMFSIKSFFKRCFGNITSRSLGGCYSTIEGCPLALVTTLGNLTNRPLCDALWSKYQSYSILLTLPMRLCSTHTLWYSRPWTTK